MQTFNTLVASLVLAIAALGSVQAAEKHLFYLHGCCVKGQDDPKVKVYQSIVQDLQSAGYNVHFDLRFADVGDNDAAVQSHAKKIADDVKALLAKGVAPSDVSIAGYSLGSMTALVASGLVANPQVNVVLLAGCPINPAIKVNIDFSKVQGRVLSIHDSKDVKFGACQGRLPSGLTFKEVLLNSGEGHAVFKSLDANQLNLWKQPMLDWIAKK